MFDITDDADHFARSRTTHLLLLLARDAAVERDALAERILARPVAPRHRLTDDHNPRLTFAILVGERAAADERNSHRREVVRVDGARLDGMCLADGLRMQVDLHPAAVVVGAERKDVDRTNGLHAWLRPNDVVQPLVERNLVTLGVGGRRHGRLERQHSFCDEAGLDAGELPQTANHQARARKQDEGERDLRGDQKLASRALQRRP